MFEDVIADEAHLVKSTEAARHVTAKWLQPGLFLRGTPSDKYQGSQHVTVNWLWPEYILLITANMIMKSISDWRGFQTFIDGNKPDPWTQESLEALGVTKDVNPIRLRHNHPGKVLCNT